MSEKKLIYIILVLLIINVAWSWFDKEVKDYSYYQTEYKHLREKVTKLGTEIKQIDYEIKELKYKMDVKDSIIRRATPIQLDSLFTDFFDRLR